MKKTTKRNLAVIVLAAGKSTRMKSETPKVLHTLCGRPVIFYVLDLIKSIKPLKAVVVLGHKHEQIRPLLPKGMPSVIQKRLLGTADAVKAGLGALRGFRGDILVLYADNPLLKKETINNLLRHHRAAGCAVTLLTAKLENPAGYGRIMRDSLYGIRGIIEEKDANDFQRKTKEINTGIMCFSKEALEEALKHIKPNNRKKEYYLTDAISVLYAKGEIIGGLRLADFREALGINSRVELARAHTVMHKRLTDEFMKQGVTIIDPATVFIGYGVTIGRDTVIYPFTVIEKGVTIGKHVSVGPFAHLSSGMRIKDNSKVSGFSVLTGRDKDFVRHFLY